MRAAHWRYLLLDNGLGAALLNAGINGAIAWAVFHRMAVVPLWGAVGIATDTVATSVILPVLTCVIVTFLTNWHVRAGRLTPLPSAATVVGSFAGSFAGLRLPEGTWARAGSLALASLVVLVPAMLMTFVGLGVDRLPFDRFLVFKVGFAVVDGILVTPLCARAALSRARA
ncbi:MAG TPA: hypothetical protein VMT47_04815 [Polyangia bacterium]|nr:hypothetical protein [Polyangia bacterium]